MTVDSKQNATKEELEDLKERIRKIHSDLWDISRLVNTHNQIFFKNREMLIERKENADRTESKVVLHKIDAHSRVIEKIGDTINKMIKDNVNIERVVNGHSRSIASHAESINATIERVDRRDATIRSLNQELQALQAKVNRIEMVARMAPPGAPAA